MSGTEFVFSERGAEDLARSLDRVDGRLGDLARKQEELAGANRGSAESAAILVSGFNQAIEVLGKVKDVVVEVAAKIREFGEEWERQAGILNRFTGDVSAARERLHGLISDLDLMKAQARLSAAGLDLTAEQFATVAVRANEFAAATGGDATQAIEQLGQALISGSDRSLRQFGIAVEGVTDRAGRQRAAIEALQTEWGDAESSADTLGGKFQELDVWIENVKTEFFETLTASQELKDAIEELGDSLERLGITAPAVADAIAGTVHVIASFFQTIADAVSSFADAVDSIRSGDFAGALRAINEAVSLTSVGGFAGRFGTHVAGGEAAGGGGGPPQFQSFAGVSRMGGVPGGGTSRRGGGGGGGGNRRREEAQALAAQLGLDIPTVGRGTAGHEMVQTDTAGSPEEQKQRDIEAANDLLGKQAELKQELLAMQQKEVELAEQQLEHLKEQEKQAAETGHAITEVLVHGIRIARDEHKSLLKGIAESVQAFAKEAAFKYALKGGERAAEAIWLSVANPPLAAAALLSSAGYFALAALAGGGAAVAGAVAGGGGGGGGAPRGQTDGPAVGSGSSREGGGGPITIVFQNNSPVDEATLGRMNEGQARAARRELSGIIR